MLQGRRELRQETTSTKISERPLRRKGRPMKEFHNFLYERYLHAESSEQSCSHLDLTCEFGVLTSHYFKVQKLSKLRRCTCSCGMVLMMHVRMTRVPIR
jgi:hypothetical protein